MTNEQKMNILSMIFAAIFQSKATNSDITKVIMTTNRGKFPGRWFVGNTLRGFDVDIDTGDKIVEIRCIEQNPNKTDNFGNLKKHANLAQLGHKIMWVIDRKGSWLGHMMDNVWVPAFEPATQPATYTKLGSQPATETYNYDTPEHEAHVDAAYAHIDKDHNDPNFHGIPGTSGTPMANLPIEAAMQHNLPQPVDMNSLPEVASEAAIPEHVLQSVSAMEEPPDWGDNYE